LKTDNCQYQIYDMTSGQPAMIPFMVFGVKPSVGELCNVNGELFEIVGVFHQATFGEVELYVKKQAEDCDCRTIASTILGNGR